MSASDARLFPLKNQAYRVTFPILDADGDPVLAASGLDSEVSKDGVTPVDCTNEAVDIGGGIYYLDLTASEMNADTVAVLVKSAPATAKTTVLVFYPLEAGDIIVNTTQWAGAATATGNIALKSTLAKGTDLTGFNDLSAAQVNIEADAALADVGMTSTVTSRIDATVSSRATQTSVDAIDGADWTNTERSQIRHRLGIDGTTQVPATIPSLAIPGDPMTLTAAYNAAKTASSQSSVNLVSNVTNRLDTTLELDGAVYRFTTNALEQAPVGEGGGAGGVADWSNAEREQIRHRLGIDGIATVPANGVPSLASQLSVNGIKTTTDKLNTTLQIDGSVYQFTANALELAPVGEGTTPPPLTGFGACVENPARTTGPTTEPAAFVQATTQRIKVLNR